MLFDSRRHEPLIEMPWNPEIARSVIHDILRVAIVDGPAWTGGQLAADWGNEPAPSNIYEGVAGLLWTLAYLEDYREEAPFEISEAGSFTYDRFFNYDLLELEDHKVSDTVPSYFIGESGIINTLWRTNRKKYESLRERLISIVSSNMDNPTLEPLWGGTGSIIPLLFDWERHGAQESRQLLNEHAAFFAEQVWVDDSAGSLWTQDMYSHQIEYLGAGHGFVGNMYPFLRARDALEEKLATWALETTIDTVTRTAVIEDDAANWSGAAKMERMLVQWCHGAPGFIISLAPVPAGTDNKFDDLLLKAGELIWKAGPLTKGVSLCHGTDGNGYAFLKLFKRTGDQMWLDRARAFAMHAIKQRSGRHALWVGDAGLACYLDACITAGDGFPLLDIV